MLNQSPSKIKSVQVSAIMNNKKLSKVIADALNSSPGSSKREKAAAMLKSLNRTSQGMSGYFDGQGGGPFDIQGSQATYGPSSNQSLQVRPQQPTGTAVSGQILQPAGLGVPPSQRYGMAATEPSLEAGGILQGPKVIQQSMPPRKEPVPAAAPIGPAPPPPAPEGDYFDQWYQAQTPEQQAENKPLFDALKVGIGPKSFAYQEMERMGFDTLAEEKTKLEASLLDKYNLDELNRNLDTLEERGLTIEDDLESYITARDQYIEKIDSMISTAQEAFSTKSNMDDPSVKRMAQNYLNYLFIMKGKQQKRYGDYLQMGIDQHNAEVTRAQNRYNDMSTLFQRELTSGRETTEDDYNRLTDVLTEMYDNVAGREKNELNMEILRNQIIKSNAEAVKAAAESISDTILTSDQKKEITTLERVYGLESLLTNEIRSAILRLLTPTERNNFMEDLSKEIRKDSGLDIIKFLREWIDKKRIESSGAIDIDSAIEALKRLREEGAI